MALAKVRRFCCDVYRGSSCTFVRGVVESVLGWSFLSAGLWGEVGAPFLCYRPLAVNSGVLSGGVSLCFCSRVFRGAARGDCGRAWGWLVLALGERVAAFFGGAGEKSFSHREETLARRSGREG